MSAALPDWKNAVERPEDNRATCIKNIVLPLDATEQSLTVLPVARTLAELYGATLHVAFVGESSVDSKSAAARIGFDAEVPPGTVFEQNSSEPLELVPRLMRDLPETLLVMSTALGPQQHETRFGSLTESIFATRPARAVLLTPEHGRRSWTLRLLLLAHDGTPVSHPATEPAADLAHRAGAELIALHVAARGEERPEAPGSIAAPLYVDQPQHEWPAWAEEFMNRVVAGGTPPSGVHFKLAVTGGQAGSELAQVARERNVDLVVMAWHGHWDHKDCATRVVIRNAGCPVMLVYSAG
jgi:nucleotide-binding universal stress UspA family protein